MSRGGPRKLLVHRRERNRLLGAVREKGVTLVPLSIYFNDRGIAKGQFGARDRQAEVRQAPGQEIARLAAPAGAVDQGAGVEGGRGTNGAFDPLYLEPVGSLQGIGLAVGWTCAAIVRPRHLYAGWGGSGTGQIMKSTQPDMLRTTIVN